MNAALADRDISFDAQDFERVRELIRAKAGIDLSTAKQNMVYSRLSRRLRECGHTSFRSYLDSLRSAPESEWQQFINCLTTNLTSFFRESHHFDTLASELQRSTRGPLRIWSCAASTGEEPYSIAMVVEESRVSAQVSIDASDIDTQVLATAQEGTYHLDNAQSLGETRLRRFFLKGSGANSGRVRVKPELRARVNFRSFNLLSPVWPAQRYDFIFCRNVMIYFDRETQRKVLQRLHQAMVPQGVLFVGHSENFTEHKDLFQLTGKTVYRRLGN